MSRWHKPHCEAPHLSLSGGTPQCASCSSVCPLKELISAQKTNPPLSFPPDELCGEMNLWWPRSVPYRSSKDGETYTQSVAQNNSKGPVSNAQQPLEDDQSHSTRESDSVEEVYLPIYGPTLSADEFRLVCISAVEKEEDGIIHVSLDTYSQTNCPEYEAVSYTWGGENGDYTLCRPIFVGPYWDVVLQSQNCWEMLRFVRPWRGIRMVWVDALCINQRNVKERGAQVAKMGQIYEQCSRVIVYLGPDIASSTRERFPSRRLLHELENDSVNPQLPDGHRFKSAGLNLREILKRNYFSRVWVIQELMPSQRAVIRIGDVDFCTDSTGSTHFKAAESPGSDWDSMAAPWVQYMAQKAFPSSNLFEVLRLTSQCRASDLRDTLFGVLGLIQPDDPERETWDPNYSLSAQHVFIGIIAHFIINLKMFQIFRYFAGISAPPTSPSWMPDWVARDSWQRIFNPRPMGDWIEMLDFVSRNIELDSGYDLLSFWNVSGEHFSREWNHTVLEKKPWHRNMFVDKNTGALSVNLIYLSAISFRPALVEKRGNLGLFEVKDKNICLYLHTEGGSETTGCPGVDHLFIAIPKNTKLMIRSLYSEIDMAHSCLNGRSDRWYDDLYGFFPGMKKSRDFMPAYRGCFNESNGSASTFEISYLSCIGQEFCPRIVNGFLELSFSTSAFHTVRGYYLRDYAWYDSISGVPRVRRMNNSWEWRRQWGKWTLMRMEQPSDSQYLPGIYLRASMGEVRKALEIIFLPIRRIQRRLGCGFDEVEALLRDGPREEHQVMGLGSLDEYGHRSDSGGHDLDLDISLREVRIL